MVTLPSSIRLWNIVFIMVWKVVGELVRPKNMTVSSYSPLLVMNAAFHRSLGLMSTSLYPHSMLKPVNSVQSHSQSISDGMSGSGYWFLIVQEFTGQWSWTSRSFPFFFLMKKNDAAYGLFEGWMVPRLVCSFRNWESSCCSVWERQMVLLMRVTGAPGFRSML